MPGDAAAEPRQARAPQRVAVHAEEAAHAARASGAVVGASGGVVAAAAAAAATAAAAAAAAAAALVVEVALGDLDAARPLGVRVGQEAAHARDGLAKQNRRRFDFESRRGVVPNPDARRAVP